MTLKLHTFINFIRQNPDFLLQHCFELRWTAGLFFAISTKLNFSFVDLQFVIDIAQSALMKLFIPLLVSIMMLFYGVIYKLNTTLFREQILAWCGIGR